MENNLESRVGKIEVKLGKLETIADDHKDEIKNLRDDNTLLHRLNANQEFLTKLMEENQQTHKETRQTLNEINESMRSISFSQEKMQNEISQMKVEMSNTNERIEQVEKKNEESNNRGKFDVLNFFTNDVMKYVLLAIVGAILVYFGIVR